MTTVRRAVAATLAVGLAASTVACGGSQAEWTAMSGSDKAEATKVVTALESNPEPAEMCRQLLSADMIDRIYSIPERCVALLEKSAERVKEAEEVVEPDVEVSGHQRNGDRGRVTVAVRGSDDADPFKGRVHLVREGGRWRVDGADEAYRRGNIGLVLGAHGGAAQALGPYDSPDLRGVMAECGERVTKKLSDRELDRTFEDLMRYDRRTSRDLGETAIVCVAEDDEGAKGLTDVFLENVSKQLTDALITEQQIACIEKNFRAAHSDAEVGQAIAEDLRAGNNMKTLSSWVNNSATGC